MGPVVAPERTRGVSASVRWCGRSLSSKLYHGQLSDRRASACVWHVFSEPVKRLFGCVGHGNSTSNVAPSTILLVLRWLLVVNLCHFWVGWIWTETSRLPGGGLLPFGGVFLPTGLLEVMPGRSRTRVARQGAFQARHSGQTPAGEDLARSMCGGGRASPHPVRTPSIRRS